MKRKSNGKRLLSVLLTLLMINSLFAMTVYADNEKNDISSDQKAIYEDDELIVRFVEGITDEEVKETISSYGCEIINYIGNDTYQVKILNNTDTLDAQTLLKDDYRIANVELNYIYGEAAGLETPDYIIADADNEKTGTILEDEAKYEDDELIVRFVEDITDEEVKETISSYGCEIINYIGNYTYQVKILNNADALDVQSLLKDDYRIANVELNYVYGEAAGLETPDYVFDNGLEQTEEITDSLSLDKNEIIKDKDSNIELQNRAEDPAKRLSGTSRYYTMASIVEEGWEDNSCSTVIVATGATFPDALSGAALAGVYDCPLILTATDSLSPGAQIELTRLSPDNVIILGSTSAVSTATENSIKAIVGSNNVVRLQGSSRYETCLAIYQYGIGNWSDTLILAAGATAPDALTASAYSFASQSPIFLVQSGTTLQSGMISAITSGAFDNVVILGAPEVISTTLENWVKAQVGSSNVIRLYGSDRYQTSSAFSEWASGNATSYSVQPVTELSYTYPAVVNGGNDHFADALSGGPFCGHNGSVMLLTQNVTTSSNYSVQNNVIPHKNEIHIGYVLGATDVLSENFRAHLNAVTQ